MCPLQCSERSLRIKRHTDRVGQRDSTSEFGLDLPYSERLYVPFRERHSKRELTQKVQERERCPCLGRGWLSVPQHDDQSEFER